MSTEKPFYIHQCSGFLHCAFLFAVLAIRLVPRSLSLGLYATTVVFVAFNKVCTAQYFMWWAVFLPLVLPHVGCGSLTASADPLLPQSVHSRISKVGCIVAPSHLHVRFQCHVCTPRSGFHGVSTGYSTGCRSWDFVGYCRSTLVVLGVRCKINSLILNLQRRFATCLTTVGVFFIGFQVPA